MRERCSKVMQVIPLRTQHVVAVGLTKSLPAPGLARHRNVKMTPNLYLGGLFSVRLFNAPFWSLSKNVWNSIFAVSSNTFFDPDLMQ